MANSLPPDPSPAFTMSDPTVTRARCSTGQQYFWRLDSADPGTPSLNIAVKWRIRGHLDAAIAQAAFQAIIERHEALRTAIVAVAGRPIQLLSEHLPFKLSEIDLSGLPEADRFGEAERIGGLEAQARFDLATAPLLRATLVRLSRTDAVLLVTAHHIVSDGWSMGILSKDFVAAYQALSRGARPSLPELALQYSDYAEWSLEGLATNALAREGTYWKARLANLPYVEVPPDHPAPVARSANGATIARLLPKPLTTRLTELARGEDTTFFTAAYAVLLILMHQRTGASDIGLSTQIAARDEVELEGVVGPFVNTLVLRTRIAREQSFLELCRSARDTFEEAVENHLWPIDRVVQAQQHGLERGRPPVSVNFIVQRAFIGELANDSFKLSGIPSNLPGALYDLNFILVEREEGWRLTCEYHRDLYDEATAAALVAQYERIAEAVVDAPADKLPRAPVQPAAPPPRPAASSVAQPVARSPGVNPAMRRNWLQQAGTQSTLFAISHTAQKFSLYRPLSQELGPDQPFATLQLMPSAPGEEAPGTLAELAAVYCEAIMAASPTGALRLVAFCRSGIIAYEAARQLEAAGRKVELVVLIDCWAPGYFLRQPYARRLLFKLRRMQRFAKRQWRAGPRSFATRMSFWLQSTAPVRRAKRLLFWRPAEEALDEAEFWRATDELEALVQRYTPEGYGGQVLMFRSEAIPAGWPPDPALGWTQHLPDGTPCQPVVGEEHEGAFSAAGSRSMAQGIRNMLGLAPR